MSSGAHVRLRRNLCLIYCGIIWILYVPFCLYGFFIYLKHRNQIILKKRHPAFNTYVLLSLLLTFSTFVPLVIIAYGLSETLTKIDDNLAWNAYGIYTVYPVLVLLLHCMFAFIWRWFLYHNDVAFYSDLGNARWTQLIYVFKYDRDHINLRSMYSTWSGVKLMIALFTLIGASLAVWHLIFASHDDDDDWILRIGIGSTVLFWCTVCVLMLSYFVSRTPRFMDHLYIRKELVHSVIVIAMTCLLVIADLVVDFLVFTHDTKFHAIVVMSNYFLIASTLCALFIISSMAVVFSNQNALKKDANSNSTAMAMEQVVRNSIQLCEMSPKTESEKPGKDSIWSELGNESVFNGFVHYLVHEFSIEILTSLIEFTQFQKMVSELSEENHLQTNFDFFVYPHSLVPQSSIVYGALNSGEAALSQHLVLCTAQQQEEEEEGKYDELDEDREFVLTSIMYNSHKNDKDSNSSRTAASVKRIEALIRSHKLFAKYVRNESLQIHLSVQEKQRLAQLMEEYNEWVTARDDDGQQLQMIFGLFDDCIQQQLSLLNAAFSRFKSLDVQRL